MEEFEAELTTMFETTLRELIKWSAFTATNGRVIWSPVKVDGARPLFEMRLAPLTKSIESTFYRDFGIDQVSGVQGFVGLRMPRLNCYLPMGTTGSPVGFEYPAFIPSPRLPDGQIPS